MRNSTVAEKGQKLVENYFKNQGWEVRNIADLDHTLPYDIVVRQKPGQRWVKIQVKTTRGSKNDVLVFRTRKSKDGKKALYEPEDLDLFVFVDAKTKTIVSSPFMKKGSFSFTRDSWDEKCEQCE